MNDPRRLDDDHPRRAEPIQPDKPGRGVDAERDERGPGAAAKQDTRRQEEQSDAALDNVSKDFG